MKKETSKISLVDVFIKTSITIAILLLLFIVYLVSEQDIAKTKETEKIRKELALLNEDIQRTENALAAVSNKIDTIEKIQQLNTKKEANFKTLNDQLENASKTVPKK